MSTPGAPPPVDWRLVSTSIPRPPSRPGAVRAFLRATASMLAGALALAVSAGPVAAHADLATASPADGSIVEGSPGVVVLTFTEPLDPGRSNFRLVGPDGQVGIGRVTDADPQVMELEVPTLEPGAYEIRWAAAGGDAHLERGRVSFTVLAAPAPAVPTPAPTAGSTPAGASPTPAHSPSPTPAASPGEPSGAAGTDGTDVLPVIVVALALVLGLSAYLMRRSRGA